MKLIRIAVLLVLLPGVVLARDKGFNPPPAAPAGSYPAHDFHQKEQATVAIDPFDTDAKAAIFKVKYKNYNLLPIRLIISNDSDKPLMLDAAKIELITASNDKIAPATRDDILRKMARPEKVTRRSPIPLPIPRDKNPISRDAREEIDSALFVNVPVMPHSSTSGFLFFDVSGVDNPEAQAHLVISGIKAGEQELFYFDIPLEAYLDQASPTQK
ncbi:MAG: hypothetical protein ACRD4I_09500 [Candidatus Angelobacter sp.]